MEELNRKIISEFRFVPMFLLFSNYYLSLNIWISLKSWFFFCFFWASYQNHYLAALDLRAGVEQPFDCLIVQTVRPCNRQAVRRSMDWTLEDNMVDDLLFCATLTGRRGGHTPFVQAGAETSDTGEEAVKPYLGCSWEGHSEWVGAGVGDENTEFCRVVRPPLIPFVIRPVRHTYVVVR